MNGSNRTEEFTGNNLFEVTEVGGRRVLAMRSEAAARLGLLVSSGGSRAEAHEAAPTAKEVRDAAAQIVDDNKSISQPGTSMEYGSRSVELIARDGRRITIERVLPGRAKPGYAIQDVCIDIEQGDSATPYPATTYNYNERGDGVMRKSVWSEEHHIRLDDLGPEGTLDEKIATLNELSIRVNANVVINELEAEMGHNDLPTSDADLAELMGLFDGATVLDPRTDQRHSRFGERTI